MKDDKALFSMLGLLMRDGKLSLKLDYKRLEHMDSPVGSEADGNIWAYGLVAAALTAWWFAGWEIALAAAVLGVAAYFTLGRAYIHRRIRRRVEHKAFADLTLWRRLWKFGGVTLVAVQVDPCTAPAGNWMALVRSLVDRKSDAYPKTSNERRL